jgi:hypothetical protein
VRTIILSTFLVLVAGCNSPDVGSAGGELTLVTGRCPTSALTIYNGHSYTGDHLCYSGTGTAFLPSGWTGDVQSFRAGEHQVTFHHPAPTNVCYPPNTNVPNTNATVEDSWAITRVLSPADAGPCF